MNADDVRPEILHFPKCRFDGGPFVDPVVVKKLSVALVIVVEPPRHERPVGFSQREALAIVKNPNPIQIHRNRWHDGQQENELDNQMTQHQVHRSQSRNHAITQRSRTFVAEQLPLVVDGALSLLVAGFIACSPSRCILIHRLGKTPPAKLSARSASSIQHDVFVGQKC